MIERQKQTKTESHNLLTERLSIERQEKGEINSNDDDNYDNNDDDDDDDDDDEVPSVQNYRQNFVIKKKKKEISIRKVFIDVDDTLVTAMNPRVCVYDTCYT